MLHFHLPVRTPDQMQLVRDAQEALGDSLPDTIWTLLRQHLAAERPAAMGRPLDWSGTSFPAGTVFRAVHRGETHDAVVNEAGQLVSGGNITTPSTFATRVTGSQRNAWLFLLVKRPSDREFVRADKLRKSS